MKSAKDMFDKLRRGPQDVVGIDIEEQETRVAHLRKSNEQITVVAADILPKIDLPKEGSGEDSRPVSALSLPQKLKAKYAALTIPGDNAIVKLLSFPGAFDAEAEQKVVQSLGLSEPDKHRISYALVSEAHGRGETKVLAVAMPEFDAAVPPKLLPSGVPVPFSLEVSGLATMTAFLNGPANLRKDAALGLLDFGHATSSFAIFNKRMLALIRRFPTGSNSIVAKVQESLGVDRETAQSILTDGAFDISQSINEVMEPLIKQLIVSRDFVERRENCRVAAIYLTGNFGASKDLLNDMKTALGVELNGWNPLDGLTVSPEALPEKLKGQEWRLASAVGACLATLEQS